MNVYTINYLEKHCKRHKYNFKVEIGRIIMFNKINNKIKNDFLNSLHVLNLKYFIEDNLIIIKENEN